jgi:hypothetical protein
VFVLPVMTLGVWQLLTRARISNAK